MKNSIILSTVLSFMTFGFMACNGSTSKQAIDNPVSGIILDATMNTVMIEANNGDTLSFSTMDADKSEAHGLLIGDSIKVFYTGKPDGNTSLTATKLIVKHIATLSDKLTGKWVAPVEGMPNMVEGMDLKENGIASSVNMATLVYESWQATAIAGNGDCLILSGKSIGNGLTIEFTDTFKIDKLTYNSLTITKGEYTRTYHKEE